MRLLIAITILLCVGEHRVLADKNPGRDDLAQVMYEACATKAIREQLDRVDNKFCTQGWASWAGHDYPAYYIQKNTMFVCPTIVSNKTQILGDDLQTRALAQCLETTSKERSGPIGTIGINLIQGLGDLLVAEAKQEATEFLLSAIGDAFCKYSFQISFTHTQPVKIQLSNWFPTTCKLIQSDAPVDVETFTIGALKTSFITDLKALPQKLADLAQQWMNDRWNNAQEYAAAIGVVVLVGYDLSQGKKPADILKQLGDLADSKLKNKLQCDFSSTSQLKECAAMFGFELARDAVALSGQSIAVIVQDAANQFCTDYGVPTKKDHGECVLDSIPATILQDVQAIVVAAQKVIALSQGINNLAQDALPSELSKRAAPEWVQDLRELVDTFGKLIVDLAPADKANVEEDFKLLDIAFDALLAVVTPDPAALVKAVSDALQSPMVTDKIGKEATHAMTVIVSLAMAKDRAEVKGILADVTAPVGTYKMKYNATHRYLAVNGFVGVLTGFNVQLHHRDTTGAASHDGRVDWFPSPRLSAPVGLDWTLASGKWLHFGVTGTVIDPLALVVTNEHDDISADWKTVWNLGLYARLGLFKSPFVLMAGGNYQPGLREDSTSCGGRRCYEGAFQFGLMLSADVPLFILH